MKILDHYMDRNGGNEPSPEAEAHASTGQALRERLKEITCLYEIRRGMGPSYRPIKYASRFSGI